MPAKIPHIQTPDALRNVSKEIGDMAEAVASVAEKMRTTGIDELSDVAMKTTFLQGMQKLTSYVAEVEKELRSQLYQRGHFGTKKVAVEEQPEPPPEKPKSRTKPRKTRGQTASNAD